MGKRHKPRSLLKKPDHIPSPRTLLYRYLNADQKSKPQHLALIHDQKKYYNCYSLADFAYLAMTNKQLPEDCYREHREKTVALIFFTAVWSTMTECQTTVIWLSLSKRLRKIAEKNG